MAPWLRAGRLVARHSGWPFGHNAERNLLTCVPRRHVHHRLRPAPSISGCDGESQLDLHQLDRDLFRAKQCSLWVPPGGRGVFGGQVVGQALHAATLTVDADRVCHSLHSYFILPGDPTHDIIYQVGRSSDRRSFTTRSVQAIQHGQTIFQAEMSFSLASDHPALAHQRPMPDVPPPDSLPSHLELLDRLLPSLPSSMHAAVEKMRNMPIEMRMVDPPDLLDPSPPKKPGVQYIWMRISQPLEASPGVHRACAAYFSDHALLTTALRPHGINFPSPRLGAVASLDHSMWFHTASFRADEWMLCALLPRTVPALRADAGAARRAGHSPPSSRPLPTAPLSAPCHASPSAMRWTRPGPATAAASPLVISTMRTERCRSPARKRASCGWPSRAPKDGWRRLLSKLCAARATGLLGSAGQRPPHPAQQQPRSRRQVTHEQEQGESCAHQIWCLSVRTHSWAVACQTSARDHIIATGTD